MEENSKMIWEIQKQIREKILKIWKKFVKMIWKIWKKAKMNSEKI